MRSLRNLLLPALLLAACAAHAQVPAAGGGKIVCWKDKSGKVVGCGDKVPPEYQDFGTKELNRRGVTVKQTEPPLTVEQKKALLAEEERKKVEDAKLAEQRRRDKALLDTFTTEQEIDLKRKRDIQLLESNIEAQQANLKNANDRQTELRNRIEGYKKNNQPVPPAFQDDFNKIEADKAKIQTQIAQKRKDIAEKNLQYDEMKKRFSELRGASAGSTQTTAATAVPPPAPAAKK